MACPAPPPEMFSARPVEWRIPIGCDFSGFFVEVALGLIPLLRPHVSELYLLQTRCPDDFLHRLAPGEAEAYLAAQVADHERTAAQTAGSIAIEHGDPCLMRDFGPAPDPRRPFRLISRLMSEGRLPPAQLKCAHRADLLWVPTSWHADLLSSQGIPRRKLRVLPEYVDTRLFAPASALRPADLPSPGRPFTFLSVFKWEERKGWDALLDAYWTAFRAGGTHPWPVRLRLRTYKPSWEPGPDDIATWIEAHAHKRFGTAASHLPPVEIVPELSRQEMAALYASADAFVLPSRGEGWCLPCMEAMSSGLPILVTNYSGVTAFMTDDNAYPIRVSAINRRSLRAEPDVVHLHQLMRHVVARPSEAAEVGARARRTILGSFSAPVVADAALGLLREAAGIGEARKAELLGGEGAGGAGASD